MGRFGDVDERNLQGTARTLDRTHGSAKMGDGILSRNGYSVIDDSESLLFDETSWLIPRKLPDDTTVPSKDLYFFAYGHDYLQVCRDTLCHDVSVCVIIRV